MKTRHLGGNLFASSAVLGLILTPCHLSAFDTGYHHDLTGAVLREFSFDDVPVKVVQVENWLVDYYSNSPTSSPAVKQELVKLHFDNLFTTKEVTWYWTRLAENSIAASKQAAMDDDPHRMLTILAISLHAVQDFYSHSNWCDTHPRPATGYSAATFLNAGAPPSSELFTGFYDSMSVMPPPGHPAHGGYSDGLNRDSQGRPDWDEAYVFAYVAGWEWTAKLKAEVDAVNAGFWEKVRTFSMADDDLKNLNFDAEAAYRISHWIASSGADGHWKGKQSGHNPSFLKFAAKWTAAPDSKSVKQFKEAKIQNLLTPNLYQGGVPPALPAFPKFNLNRKLVVIQFTNVKEKGDEGFLEPRIDVGGDADFFARVKLGDVQYVERVLQDKKSFNAPWWTLGIVDPANSPVAVSVDVLDEDFFASGDDDVCDVNPTEDKKAIEFSVALTDATLSGDVQGIHRDAMNAVTIGGKKPDKDRAVVSFAVDVQSITAP